MNWPPRVGVRPMIWWRTRLAAYLAEVAEVRTLLDSRYDDIESGRVGSVDGEAFFESLRQRENDLIERRSLK
jgi:hypothetical protein